MKLKTARHVLRIAQKELARRANTTQATISLTECGKTKPQEATRNRIEKILGFEIDWSEENTDADEVLEQEITHNLYRSLMLPQPRQLRVVELTRRYLDYLEGEEKVLSRH